MLLIGKSTISMGHFPVRYVSHYQRVNVNSLSYGEHHGIIVVRDFSNGLFMEVSEVM